MKTFTDLEKSISKILVSTDLNYVYLFNESGSQYNLFTSLNQVLEKTAKKLVQHRIVSLDLDLDENSKLDAVYLNSKRNQICLRFNDARLVFLRA